MLKKYWNREQEEMGAMVIESEILDRNEMNLFTYLQTELQRCKNQPRIDRRTER